VAVKFLAISASPHFHGSFRHHLNSVFLEAPIACAALFLSSARIYAWWAIFFHNRPWKEMFWNNSEPAFLQSRSFGNFHPKHT